MFYPTPPSQPQGPTFAAFVNSLTAKPEKAKKGSAPVAANDEVFGEDALNRAVRSTHAANRGATVSAGEWGAYLQVLLVTCFTKKKTPSDLAAIAHAASLSTKEFKQAYQEDLAAYFKLFPKLAKEVVTHVSKVVHTSAPNDILANALPATAELGHLCSGDLAEHTYSLGSSQSFAGKRHFFEGAAWRDGQWVSVIDELRDEDSLTSAHLVKLGLPEAALEAVRGWLQSGQLPLTISSALRQVYAKDAQGQDILLTPVPSVAMLSFLMNGRSPQGTAPWRTRYSVGGEQPGNAGGLSCSAGGNFSVLHASIPATLMPSAKDALKGAHRPETLLSKVSSKTVSFLLANTSAWPNATRQEYLRTNLTAVLEVMCARLIAAVELAQEYPEALQDEYLKKALAESSSPLAKVLLGDRCEQVLADVAHLLSAKVGESLGAKVVLTPEHTACMQKICRQFTTAMWA